MVKPKRRSLMMNLNDYLPDYIVNSDKIEDVIALIEKNNIIIEEEGLSSNDDDEEEDDDNDNDNDNENESRTKQNKKIVSGEKDSAIDDPIRLYLREIGKEHLLTAEQEVELSKMMEDGENIIKRVIRDSGMLIPEFYELSQKTFSRLDPRDLELSKKEISELLAERRRLNQFYRESLKEVSSPLKAYIDQKRKVLTMGGSILEDPVLKKKAVPLFEYLKEVDIHQDEIVKFSEKFINAERKINKYRKDQRKIEKRLG